MKQLFFSLLMGLLLFLFFISSADAHCEIPCGIYDDELRTKLVAEHATTIEKSMKQIIELSKSNSINYNQLARWISNKEAHASEIQNIISQYFLTQRIKPDQKKYAEKLAVLHNMLIAAMKCKQTIDLSQVDALRKHLKNFEVLYFGQSHN